MKLIDKIRKCKDEAITAMKWPFRYKMIQRAFDSVSDAVGVAKDKMESKLLDLRVQLTKVESDDEAKSIVKQIIEARLDYDARVASAELAKVEQSELDSEVKEDE
jgi:hypothetical protein